MSVFLQLVFVAAWLAFTGLVVGRIEAARCDGLFRRHRLAAVRERRRVVPGYRDELRTPSGRVRRTVNRARARLFGS